MAGALVSPKGVTGSVVRYRSSFRLALIGFRPALGHELGPNGAQAEGAQFFTDTLMTITDSSGAILMKSGDIER